MSTRSPDSAPAINTVLGLDARASRWRRWLPWGVAALLLVAVGLVLWLARPPEAASMRFVTAEATRGDLLVTVTATGTLEPVNQVEVGTEISGNVETVLVDFNDRVRVGQVLARLDTDQLEARLRQSEAALALARARVEEAQATIVETRNKLTRVRELTDKALSSREERDIAEASFARAQAALAVTQAQVIQAQAQLDADRTVLEKAQIRSPIDGLVLKREVEPGQTVAASLQTPVLFVLAENLAQMELNAAVDEADVGQVQAGQAAQFTVDAFPQRRFDAVIEQIRYAPETVDGVVTYETVLAVDNTDLILRPGMTATVDIRVDQRADVLLVPNAALRFTPATQGRPRAANSASLLSRLFPRPIPSRKPKHETSADGRSEARVWTLRDGEPAPIRVTIGPSDGQMTEVLSGAVEPGMALIVDALSTRK
jgi:HlyD family secretion protein